MIIVKDRTEVALVGIGGQGVLLIGKILGEAAIFDNKNTVQTTEYTDAARGGFSKSEVVISEQEIAFPGVLEPDVVLALSQQAYDMYKDQGCLLIYDDDIVTAEGSYNNIKGYPITSTAEKLNNLKVLNIISLGIILANVEIVPYESAVKALKHNIPAQYLDLNLKAFNEGFARGQM